MKSVMVTGMFAVLVGIGCGHAAPREPLRVRAADLATLPAGEVEPGRTMIIEIAQGEIIPLEVSVEGDLVAAPPTRRSLSSRSERFGSASATTVSRSAATVGPSIGNPVSLAASASV